ncbi:hypothetical protein, conserved [Eimeria maxima]|uniref:Uncharacterized protein n=1 Tax=Eimeria maxima TaxID=5804 RepID=U6MB23_EIMMA|nr:hypothetical protein, conserved [Eimeria maxima]CDJ61417.1 hypothetical protein, conserved [Eimeria maxima]
MGGPGAPAARAAAGAAGAAGGTAAAASAAGGAGGFSADDLERARASFRVLLETASCLLPAADGKAAAAAAAAANGATAAAGAAGGLQTSVLLLLTRLCEESWSPELLAEMIVAAERHRRDFIYRAQQQQLQQ